MENRPVTEGTPYPSRDCDETVLDLFPAMESTVLPDWSGARWIGVLDLEKLAGVSSLRLKNADGYRRARLLIRQGRSVRGFVDVETSGGVLDRSVLEEAIGSLPAAPPSRPRSIAPTITVVVCTRDRAPMLRPALRAILALNYPNFDVIVVDNAATTDETREMVRREFESPRLHLVSEPVPGLSHARNTGLRHARGDIVAFTDDDVVVDKQWLWEIAEGFERSPRPACVTGLVASGEARSPTQAYFENRVSWSKNVVPKVFSLAEPPEELPTFPFCIGNFGTGANFALDRLRAVALGGFDTALGAGTRTRGGEDVDMFTRVIFRGYSLVVQPSAIVWHRHRDGLEDLRAQARGYGIGLGAWITKIALNPRTAWWALMRSPLAIRRLLANSRQVPIGADAPDSTAGDQWDVEMAKVGRLELFSVARGPFNYLIQSWTDRRHAR
ncbi:glycosyltransferase family 2 protein [Arthrobacter frigidicola]|nr:glycosyltransferase family 2 protein [Arthrobacter frigidicola]